MRVVLALSLALVAGCGGATTLPFVGGPSTLPDAELFQHATETARAHGYNRVEESPASGRFAVQAHTTGSRGQTANFVVQFYRPGWVQVTAESTAVRREGDRMHMSGSLYTEFQEFAVWITAPLAPGASGGEAR